MAMAPEHLSATNACPEPTPAQLRSLANLAYELRAAGQSSHHIWLSVNSTIQALQERLSRTERRAASVKWESRRLEGVSRLQKDQPQIQAYSRDPGGRSWKPHRKPHHKTLWGNQRGLATNWTKLAGCQQTLSEAEAEVHEHETTLLSYNAFRQELPGSWDSDLTDHVLVTLFSQLGPQRTMLGSTNRRNRATLLLGHQEGQYEAFPSGYIPFMCLLSAEIVMAPQDHPINELKAMEMEAGMEAVVAKATDLWFGVQGDERQLSAALIDLCLQADQTLYGVGPRKTSLELLFWNAGVDLMTRFAARKPIRRPLPSATTSALMAPILADIASEIARELALELA
jgi:hypothetical protein